MSAKVQSKSKAKVNKPKDIMGKQPVKKLTGTKQKKPTVTTRGVGVYAHVGKVGRGKSKVDIAVVRAQKTKRIKALRNAVKSKLDEIIGLTATVTVAVTATPVVVPNVVETPVETPVVIEPMALPEPTPINASVDVPVLTVTGAA